MLFRIFLSIRRQFNHSVHTLFFLFHTNLVAANGDENVLLWNLEAGGHLCLQVSLVSVLTETRHLARTRHLHAQQHVCTRQAGKRKHRHLYKQTSIIFYKYLGLQFIKRWGNQPDLEKSFRNIRSLIKRAQWDDFNGIYNTKYTKMMTDCDYKAANPYLAGNAATPVQHIDRLHTLPHDNPGCHGDEVMVKCLGDEREGPRHTNIALNHLELVVLVTYVSKQLQKQFIKL